MSQLTISGAVSGMDTASIVDQLVQVEGRQQAMMQARQSKAQKASDAYASLITSLSSIADKARTLAKTSAWNGASATSSSSSVTAKVTGTQSSSLTFDVTALAAAHTIVSSDTVGTTSAVVASGPLTFTKADGTSTTIDVGTGSLSEVVSAINASSTGLRAAAVQTAPGAYRLQVAAGSSGEASQFTLTGLDGFTGMSTLTAGADATISMGTDPLTAYEIRSSSNTFSNIAAGVSFTVSKKETGVTVESAVDGAAVAKDVSALVDAVNSVLSSMTRQTAYDATSKTGGPLLGEHSVRQLQQRILSAVGLAGAPGVQLTRDGKLKFDTDGFTTAFKADPAAVAKSYGASVSLTGTSGVTGGASLVRATDSARAGQYSLSVSVAPAREQWQMDPPGGVVGGQTLTLTRGSTVVSYTAGAGDSLADFVAAVNARSISGLGVGATLQGGSMVLTSLAAGKGQAFTVDWGGSSGVQLTAGADVQGSIDGQLASGAGDVLTLASGTGGAVGLAIRTTVTAADVTASGGNVGTITYGQGLAQRLVSLVDDATNSTKGSLTAAQSGRRSDIKDLQSQIDSWSLRLDARRSALTRQFTAMETAMSSMKSKSSALSGLSLG